MRIRRTSALCAALILVSLIATRSSRAATPNAGSFNGQQSNGQNLDLVVNGSSTAVTSITYSHNDCGSGSGTINGTFAINGSGSFGTGTSGFCPSYNISGTFNTATTASGSITLSWTPVPNVCFCSASVTRSWTANWVPPPPTVAFAAASSTAAEAGGSASVNVVLTTADGNPTPSQTTVNFSTADGTASSGSDYTASSGTLTFPAGSASGATQPVSVPILDDGVDEADETFTASLSAPSGGTVASPGVHTFTITDDDSPTVSIGDATVTEGNAGTVSAVLTLTLTASSPQEITLSYATADGTATATDADYAAASGTLTIAAGATTAQVQVAVTGDTSFEQNEQLFVTLSNPVNVDLGDATGAITIVNDDTPGPSDAETELGHGTSMQRGLAPVAGGVARVEWFRIVQAAYSSYEVVVDAAGGDVGAGEGPLLRRIASDGTTVVQTAQAVGNGPARSLRWHNASGGPVDGEFIRVASASCATDCGADDTYRIRTYETTYAIPRFNNAGSQITVLVLQNPADYPAAGTVYFWSTAGTPLGSSAFSVGSRATLVLNTSTVPGVAGVSGTITVAHNARYGDLAGKTVALEPSTGFSFDTPMTVRPR